MQAVLGHHFTRPASPVVKGDERGVSPQALEVVVLVRVSSSLSDLFEVSIGSLCVVLMIARDGHGEPLEPAPGMVVALAKILSHAPKVGGRLD